MATLPTELVFASDGAIYVASGAAGVRGVRVDGHADEVGHARRSRVRAHILTPQPSLLDARARERCQDALAGEVRERDEFVREGDRYQGIIVHTAPEFADDT